MLWRLIFILSALALIVGMVARSWFGGSVKLRIGRRACATYRNMWQQAIGGEPGATAWECGEQIRRAALSVWQQDDAAAWQRRDATKRFGQIMPPLSIVLGVLGALVHRVPIFGALALILATSALATWLGLASIPAELAAVQRFLVQLRNQGVFANDEDFQLAAECARAAVWDRMLPAMLRKL